MPSAGRCISAESSRVLCARDNRGRWTERPEPVVDTTCRRYSLGLVVIPTRPSGTARRPADREQHIRSIPSSRSAVSARVSLGGRSSVSTDREVH